MSSPISSQRRVVITGLGAVTPCGNSAAATWDALVSGRSGIGRVTRFDAAGCTAQIAGEVRDFDPARALSVPLRPRGASGEALAQALTPKDIKKFGRFTHLGVGAAVEAYADSGLDPHRAMLAPERIGVNLGVGLGGLPEMEAMHDTWKAGGFRKISPFFIIQIAPNLLAGQVSLLLDARGPNMSVASACATSGHALGEAAAAIARGDADVMIAGGAESTVTPLAIGAFAQMRALSTRNDAPEKASRPYDRDRDGFVLSEGSVVFVLEEREQALRRGARVYAELRGYGASADAYHLSSLAPGAEGSARAMAAAASPRAWPLVAQAEATLMLGPRASSRRLTWPASRLGAIWMMKNGEIFRKPPAFHVSWVASISGRPPSPTPRFTPMRSGASAARWASSPESA